MSLIIGIVLVMAISGILSIVFRGWFDIGPVFWLSAIALAIVLAFSGYLLFLIIIGGLIAVGSLIAGLFSA